LLLMLFITLAPLFALILITANNIILSQFVVVLGIYIAIAPRSLKEHAKAVGDALNAGSLDDARFELSKLVSRDTQSLDERAISAACCESVLENGCDSIFAALFWFCLATVLTYGHYQAGLCAVITYRAVNTLDAMWGYKNDRYLAFGWAAARADDILNYCPARLVALSYAMLGNFKRALHCWFTQAPDWKSPNAGPVMAAGAGSLNILLGGAAIYHGNDQSRPLLGAGEPAQRGDIRRTLALVQHTLLLWIACILVLDWTIV
jgi:adenosylcobinamide-phosphate synthase